MRAHLSTVLTVLVFAAASAFAQLPAFSVVNTGLDATFSNAGKGIFDPQTSGFSGVAFGAGLFVAVGSSTTEDVIRWATSPDGTTWTGRSQTIGGGMRAFGSSKVHFLNGKFLFFAAHSLPNNAGAVTMVYSSADGLTWTQNKVADGRPGFEEFDASPTLTVVAGSNGGQMASSDLVTWRAAPVIPNAGGFDHLDLAYGNGKFFSSINGFGGTTYSSTDAVTWTSLAQANVIGGSRVEFGNGLVIINAGNDRYKSSDGVTFTKFTATTSPTSWLPPGGSPRFTGGRFLATAIDLATFVQAYMSSTDAQSWTPFASYPAAPAAPVGQNRFYFHSDIAFGNGKFVIAGTDTTAAAAGNTVRPLIMTLDAPAAPTPAVIASQPKAQTISVGGTAVFSVTATGATSYQWKLNGAAVSGATAATLVIRNATAANAGNYTVDAISSAGNTTSSAVALTLSSNPDFGRISNLSILTSITAAEPSFTVGTVVGGSGTSGTKALLVRAVGPSLTQLGVGGALPDPKLDVFVGQSVIATNDNWNGDAALSAAFSAVGAFAYASAAAKDAAVFNPTAPATSYTVQVNGVGGATGAVIAEVYDSTPAANFTASTPRLTNVSVLKSIPAGSILTAGFVIGGSTAKTVLVRAIGPRLALAPFGIGSAMADPKLDVFSGQTVIASNDNWGGAAHLTTVGTAVGAFAVTDAASKDAMLVITLAPGSYTAQVSGVNNTGGTAIVEVYEVP